MNCLIILLLLACGGNGWGCGCGCARNVNGGCRDGRDRSGDCSCRGEERGSDRRPRMPERDECDCRHGGPAAWNEGREGRRNNYPGISGDESCGCDAE